MFCWCYNIVVGNFGYFNGIIFYIRGYFLGYCIVFVIFWCVYFYMVMMFRVVNEMGWWDGLR